MSRMLRWLWAQCLRLRNDDDVLARAEARRVEMAGRVARLERQRDLAMRKEGS